MTTPTPTTRMPKPTRKSVQTSSDSPKNDELAARSLGLSREALRYKLQKYGLAT